MAPYSEFLETALCEYFDHTLSCTDGIPCFQWRIVHCQRPPISAIEILDMNGYVIATAHTIGTSSIPTENQVTDVNKVPTHNARTERSFLIRGVLGDFAILKASWKGFKTTQLKTTNGNLKLKLFKLNEPSPKWTKIRASDRNALQFAWELDEGYGSLNMDISRNEIQIPKETRYLPENTCIATTTVLAFVLCQPRHPPMKIETKNRIKTEFLLAAGLYTFFLPRWYHETCHGSWFYQMHPDVYCVTFGKDYDEYISGYLNIFTIMLMTGLILAKKKKGEKK